MNRSLLALVGLSCSLLQLSAAAKPSAKLPTSFATALIDQNARGGGGIGNASWQQVEVDEYEFREIGPAGAPKMVSHFLIANETTWHGDHGTMLIGVNIDISQLGFRYLSPTTIANIAF